MAGLPDLVAAELNVKGEVGFAEGEAGLVAYRLVPNFPALGPRFGRDAQAVAAALRQAPATLAAELAPRLRAGERVELAGRAGLGRAGPDEAGVVEEPVIGWRVVPDGATVVALDLELSPELRWEGLARDLVRAVQDLRKAAGLAVDDRIELAVKADGEAAAAVAAHRDYLLGETLATSLHTAPQGRRPRHPGRPGRPGGQAVVATGPPGAGGDRPGARAHRRPGGPGRRRRGRWGTSGPRRTAWWGSWRSPPGRGRCAGAGCCCSRTPWGLASFLRWRGFAAITLGHVIVTNRRLNDGLLAHELEHVAQAERWGLLYYLAYLLGSVRGTGATRSSWAPAMRPTPSWPPWRSTPRGPARSALGTRRLRRAVTSR